MSLLVWLPLVRDNTNQGLLDLTPTDLGTVSYINGGKIGKCLSAGDGTSSTGVNGLSYNSNLVEELGTEFSCAVWVKPLGNHLHYEGAIISSGNWNSTCWAFGLTQGNDAVDVFSKSYNRNITCSVPINQWTHLCCTSDNGIVKLYKNGEYVGSTTQSTTLASDATNFTVGRETYASGYFSFNGNLNDLRIYNHVLSLKEIKELAKGLVTHYPLDNNGQGDDEDYDDTVEYDVSGNGNNGTKAGSIVYSSDTARYSVSTLFTNGLVDKLTAPIIIGDGTQITISVWMKSLDGSTGTGSYHMPININGSEFEFSIPTTGKFRQGFVISGSRKVADYGSTNLLDKKWHMLSATFDGTNIKRYIDGVLVDTTAASGTLSTGNKNIYIGTYGSSTQYASKNILESDLRIYATALSADDIKELYQTSASIDNKGNMFAYDFSEPSNDELLAVPYTNSIYVSDPTAEYTVRNADGEYYYEGAMVSSGSEYIKINPTGKTYYYDTMVSVSAGNQFYIGFERYDANKTSRSNQACVYIIATKPSTDLVRYRYRGTINLSTDGVNPCDTIRIRILNGWTGSDSSSTKKATVHYLSLREVSALETTSISKQGIVKTDMLLESDLTDIEKTGTVNMKQFIER